MKRIILIMLSLIIAGCGDGGSGSGMGEQSTDNAQPSISGTPPTEIDADQAYTFTPNASDPDGDSLTFSIENAPEWVSFDAGSGALTGTPSDDDIGSYSSIEISVSDGNGGTASLSEFSISVNPALPTISVKQVETTSTALVSTSLDLSNYSAVTMLSSNAMDASGQAIIEFAEANKGQTVFVSGADDEPIGVAYFSQSQIESGTTDITVESLADGIIMSNPMLIGYVWGDREAILEQIKTTADYDTYTDYIESVLSESPDQLLDEEQYPRVFEDSITLILNAIDTLGGNSTQVLKTAVQPMSRTAMAKSSATTPSPIIGDDDGPYLSDVSGDNILAVNPTMVFYGIEADGKETQLISGKTAAFALIFKEDAEPVEEEFSIGDGNFEFSFTKNALNKPGGRLSATANTLKITCMFLDVISFCPVSNKTIEATVELDDSLSNILLMYGDDFLITNVHDVFDSVIDKITDPNNNAELGAITRALYKNADDVDGAVKFFKNAKKVLKTLNKINKAYTFVQKTLPFSWDFVASPIQRSWCITQENGVLDTTTTCSYLPPSGSFSYSPSSDIYVGDQISFDASSSTDPIYESTSLEYKWDFNGDGVADTDWSTTDTANHTYSGSGIFSALLYVRNPDGIEDIMQMDIEIKANTESAPSYEGFSLSSIRGVFGSSYDTYNQVCISEFGSNHRLADWTDLETFFSSGGNLQVLVNTIGLDEASASVSVNGDVNYSSSRDYFVAYHNHSKPGYFLAHDNIDNYFLSLGSWTGDRFVLCLED